MDKQKSFEHNGLRYLMVALQLDDKVVIRVSREGEFLFDSEMLSETYQVGLAGNINLVEESFDIIEYDIKIKL